MCTLSCREQIELTVVFPGTLGNWENLGLENGAISLGDVCVGLEIMLFGLKPKAPRVFGEGLAEHAAHCGSDWN